VIRKVEFFPQVKKLKDHILDNNLQSIGNNKAFIKRLEEEVGKKVSYWAALNAKKEV
jgi:porphobilinogen deaminase